MHSDETGTLTHPTVLLAEMLPTFMGGYHTFSFFCHIY